MYTHSNQRVVGGSKAEELISRAAVRDVFELKMYSQLPANHLIGTIEVHTAPHEHWSGSLILQTYSTVLSATAQVQHCSHVLMAGSSHPKYFFINAFFLSPVMFWRLIGMTSCRFVHNL